MFVPLVHSPGHAQADFGEAMAVIGGVPRSILYDNTKLAVARILGDGKRQRTRVFTELQSHYLFEDRFGRPGKGNDKGKVEGLVGFIRRTSWSPSRGPRASRPSTMLSRDSAAGARRRGCGVTRRPSASAPHGTGKPSCLYPRHHTMPATSALDG